MSLLTDPKRVVVCKFANMVDGEYEGTWGGYRVTFNYDGETIEASSVTGIRTPSAPCIVTLENGIATVRVKK